MINSFKYGETARSIYAFICQKNNYRLINEIVWNNLQEPCVRIPDRIMENIQRHSAIWIVLVFFLSIGIFYGILFVYRRFLHFFHSISSSFVFICSSFSFHFSIVSISILFCNDGWCLIKVKQFGLKSVISSNNECVWYFKHSRNCWYDCGRIRLNALKMNENLEFGWITLNHDVCLITCTILKISSISIRDTIRPNAKWYKLISIYGQYRILNLHEININFV